VRAIHQIHLPIHHFPLSRPSDIVSEAVHIIKDSTCEVRLQGDDRWQTWLVVSRGIYLPAPSRRIPLSVHRRLHILEIIPRDINVTSITPKTVLDCNGCVGLGASNGFWYLMLDPYLD
jgi:hypothetical protein